MNSEKVGYLVKRICLIYNIIKESETKVLSIKPFLVIVRISWSLLKQ